MTKSTVEAQEQLEIKGWDEKTSSKKRLYQKKSLHKNGYSRNSTEVKFLLSSPLLARVLCTVYCVTYKHIHSSFQC